jgi:hypothetical protein
MMWLPLAASLILVAAVGAYAVRLQTRLGELQSSMAVMSAPDLVRIDLAGQPTAPQSTGRALWSRDRGMVFATANLPAPPAGKVYQVWVVTAQAPVSAGLVVPDSAGGGTMYFYTPPDIPQPTAVAVTLEPAEESLRPRDSFTSSESPPRSSDQNHEVPKIAAGDLFSEKASVSFVLFVSFVVQTCG